METNSWGASGICVSCGESDCYGECRNECYQTGEHFFILESDGSEVCEWCGRDK